VWAVRRRHRSLQVLPLPLLRAPQFLLSPEPPLLPLQPPRDGGPPRRSRRLLPDAALSWPAPRPPLPPPPLLLLLAVCRSTPGLLPPLPP
jgi:hypothetical protein